MSTLTDRLKQQFDIIAQTAPELRTIPFGAWLPDLPALGNPGATVAKNVIPTSQVSYGPIGALQAATDALDARALGAIRARSAAGNYYNYAGDASKLYEVRVSGITDKSKAGGYSTGAEDVWEFALFKDQLVATNYADAVQVLTAGGAGLFADLFTSTEKPKAKHAAVIGNFLVLANINSTADGVVPNRVAWSAFGDITDMDPDAQTQSDYSDRPFGGGIQKVVGHLQYGLIFQETAIARMTYTGAANIFQFDRIDKERGTPLPQSVISHGRFSYFISEEGFYVNDGTQSYPVGDEQVDETFWKQFDIANAHFMSAAIDPLNKLVAWAFPGAGGIGKIYFYSWQGRPRWSEAEIDLEILVNTTSEALSLEDLDALYPSLEAMDAAGVTLDSAQFKGGGLLFGAFDAAHKLAYFGGANLEATIETGESELFAGRYARVTKGRPLIDGGTITGAVAGRETQQAAVAFDAAVETDGIGEFGWDNESRFHRFRCTVEAGGTWEHAQGVQVQASPMGTQGFG